MVVDGTAHLVLDHVQSLALGPDLLPRDGHAAHALGSAFDKAVKMALACGADDHDVVRPVMGRHAHAPYIVLEPAGGDLRCDGLDRLGVHVVHEPGGGQGHALLQGRGAILIGELAHGEARLRRPPGPAPAAGTVALQVLQNLPDVDVVVGVQPVAAHWAPPANRAAASSHSSPLESRTPASRRGRPLAWLSL